MTTSLTFITQNPAMRAIIESLDRVIPTDSSILITGETGVGKELIAEYIHRSSPRALQPFVKISLTALPQDLLESELFGHERGAYTSANSERRGLFELAHTGTLFLDDIDDFPFHLQSKLLRVLESREIMRIGGHKSISVDVRIVSASKVDLKTLVEKNLFRADLFYRLNVVPVLVPPLRDRTDDLPLLIAHFLKKYSPEKEIPIEADALAALSHYRWPGNIRELRNVVQRIALNGHSAVTVDRLPIEIRNDHPITSVIQACQRCLIEKNMSFEQITVCLEMNLLQQALQQTNGNRTTAAKQLGLSLSTFRDKLKKYGIE